MYRTEEKMSQFYHLLVKESLNNENVAALSKDNVRDCHEIDQERIVHHNFRFRPKRAYWTPETLESINVLFCSTFSRNNYVFLISFSVETRISDIIILNLLLQAFKTSNDCYNSYVYRTSLEILGKEDQNRIIKSNLRVSRLIECIS